MNLSLIHIFYYYIYTLSGHQNYVNAYMMSRESPLTGFVKPEGNDIFLFSSPENQVWGPGHGNVFYDEGDVYKRQVKAGKIIFYRLF